MGEYDFGIDGYQPKWLNTVPELTAAHGERLASLTGRTLTNSWLVWEPTWERWFSDCPVVLDFEGDHVEFNHQKYTDLSITWNVIDLEQPVRWSSKAEVPSVWRDDVSEGLSALRGQTLKTVLLLERDAGGDLAVGFVFSEGQLTIHNGCDANALDFDVLDSHFRRHRLG
ncbi:hypothetical protein [Amycolatopsis sp. NPDC059657]|uniref:hypothetical protein n=1 Tax=Amycolatopsis sp. NPDC059657 TaxID=3346899 RepID=UPI00366A7142